MKSLKHLVNEKGICSLPWVHTEVNLQNNNIGPCCKYQGKLGTVSEGFNVVWFNQYTNQLRTDIKNQTARNECSKCTSVSNDTFSYKSWKNNFYNNRGILDNIDVNSVELPKVFHFSLNNVCNLACRMCGPGSSSKLNTLAQDPVFSDFFKPVAVNNKFPIDQLRGSFKNLEYITISGGEPLVNTDCLVLIDLISKETKNLKAVAFSTNMTVINKALLEMLASLNVDVKFNISLDGPPHIHEYIRVGCNWSDILNNIKYIKETYPQFKFGINTTVSALNAGYIHELLQSIKSIEETYNIMFLDIMPSPVFNDYLHVGVLPNDVKQLYKTRLENIDVSYFPISEPLIKTALDFLEKDYSNNLSRFIDFTKVFDCSVKTEITSVYPEFKLLY